MFITGQGNRLNDTCWTHGRFVGQLGEETAGEIPPVLEYRRRFLSASRWLEIAKKRTRPILLDRFFGSMEKLERSLAFYYEFLTN